MRDEHRRAIAFCRRGDMAGSREEASPLGRVVRDDELALRHDSNYLDVERPSSLDALEAELRRTGVATAFFEDEALGESLAPEASRRGWDVFRGVVMVYRGEPPAPAQPVSEVGEAEVRPLRREQILAEHWGTPAVADQLLHAKVRIGERVATRFFAVHEHGRPVAAADLYLAPPEAQVEDVGTDPAHRGRGLGTAVVSAAVGEARDAGAEFVFLVADAEDWPKDWYARLGFEAVGRYVKLTRPD